MVGLGEVGGGDGGMGVGGILLTASRRWAHTQDSAGVPDSKPPIDAGA